MSDTVLRTIQADVMGLLKAVPGLALAQVLSADEGLTEADVQQKLSHLTGATKIGLAVIVMQPEIPRAEKNLPGPVVRVEQSIQVIESVLINRSGTGTEIPANVASMQVASRVHARSRMFQGSQGPMHVFSTDAPGHAAPTPATSG